MHVEGSVFLQGPVARKVARFLFRFKTFPQKYVMMRKSRFHGFLLQTPPIVKRSTTYSIFWSEIHLSCLWKNERQELFLLFCLSFGHIGIWLMLCVQLILVVTHLMWLETASYWTILVNTDMIYMYIQHHWTNMIIKALIFDTPTPTPSWCKGVNDL